MIIQRTSLPTPVVRVKAEGQPPDQGVDLGLFGSGAGKRAVAFIRSEALPFYKKYKPAVKGGEAVYNLIAKDVAKELGETLPAGVDATVRGGLLLWGLGETATTLTDPQADFWDVTTTLVKLGADTLLFADSLGFKTVNPLLLKTASVSCTAYLPISMLNRKTGEKSSATYRATLGSDDLAALPKREVEAARTFALGAIGGAVAASPGVPRNVVPAGLGLQRTGIAPHYWPGTLSSPFARVAEAQLRISAQDRSRGKT